MKISNLTKRFETLYLFYFLHRPWMEDFPISWHLNKFIILNEKEKKTIEFVYEWIKFQYFFYCNQNLMIHPFQNMSVWKKLTQNLWIESCLYTWHIRCSYVNSCPKQRRKIFILSNWNETFFKRSKTMTMFCPNKSFIRSLSLSILSSYKISNIFNSSKQNFFIERIELNLILHRSMVVMFTS